MLKYLKRNKATSSESISAGLLKNGGPSMVEALHEIRDDPEGLD
jgi:hypothetical protein